MRSAFRRELSRTGFQILGLLLGLLIVLLLGFLYGQQLENEVGEVNDRQQRDHRHIVAIERGHPLTSKGGDALQTPSTAHQPPSPPHGGHTGNHVTPHNGGIKPPTGPQSPITGALQPAPVVPQPSPGNSNSTPAAENSNGVTACVESVVSACVKAETPELPLHP